MNYNEFIKELCDKKAFLQDKLDSVFANADETDREDKKIITEIKKWISKAEKIQKKSPKKAFLRGHSIKGRQFNRIKAKIEKYEDEYDYTSRKHIAREAKNREIYAGFKTWHDVLIKNGFYAANTIMLHLLLKETLLYNFNVESISKCENHSHFTAEIDKKGLELCYHSEKFEDVFYGLKFIEQNALLHKLDELLNKEQNHHKKHSRKQKIEISTHGTLTMNLDHKSVSQFRKNNKDFIKAIKLVDKELSRKYPFKDMDYYEKASIEKLDLLSAYLENPKDKRYNEQKIPLLLSAFGCLLDIIITSSRNITKDETKEYFLSYVNEIIDFKRELKQQSEIYDTEEFDLDEKKYYLNELSKMSEREFERKKKRRFEG